MSENYDKKYLCATITNDNKNTTLYKLGQVKRCTAHAKCAYPNHPACTIGVDKMCFFVFFSIKKVLIIFLFLNENICCGYSLEAHRLGASNKYPQHMFLWRIKKNIYLIHVSLLSWARLYLYPIRVFYSRWHISVDSLTLVLLTKLKCHAHF